MSGVQDAFVNARRRLGLVWVSILLGLVCLGAGLAVSQVVHPPLGFALITVGFLVAVIPGAVITLTDFETQKALSHRVAGAMQPGRDDSSDDLAVPAVPAASATDGGSGAHVDQRSS